MEPGAFEVKCHRHLRLRRVVAVAVVHATIRDDFLHNCLLLKNSTNPIPTVHRASKPIVDLMPAPDIIPTNQGSGDLLIPAPNPSKNPLGPYMDWYETLGNSTYIYMYITTHEAPEV